MSQKGLRVEFQLPSQRKAKEAPAAPVKDPVPRIARLLTLAHKWEGMVKRGEVQDYAEIARRMGLSRARVTQISSLCLLAPQCQERMLLPAGHDSHPTYSSERSVRSIVSDSLWTAQCQFLQVRRQDRLASCPDLDHDDYSGATSRR